MTDTTEVLTRRLLALDEQIEALTEARKATVAALVESHKPGDKILLDGQPVYKVQTRRTFDVEKAKALLPENIIQAATVPMLDQKLLKTLMPPAVVAACMRDGATFVSRA